MNKILMIFEFVFGCWHGNLSRPFTLSGSTYEVCLNCGKKFMYDRAEILNKMMRREKLALVNSASPHMGQRSCLSSGAFVKIGKQKVMP